MSRQRLILSLSCQALLEFDLTEQQRQCHLAQMDSVAFVKYLKQVGWRRSGVGPASPPPFPHPTPLPLSLSLSQLVTLTLWRSRQAFTHSRYFPRPLKAACDEVT